MIALFGADQFEEKVELLHEKFRELGIVDYDRHLGVHSSRLTVILNEQGRAMVLTASS